MGLSEVCLVINSEEIDLFYIIKQSVTTFLIGRPSTIAWRHLFLTVCVCVFFAQKCYSE